MRELAVALVVSAAIHASAIAWVRTHPAAKPEPPRPVTNVPIQIVPPEPPPTVVALLDDHSVAHTGPGASTPRHTRAGARRITTTTAHVIETPPAEPPKHSALMTMRHPEIETGPSSTFMERFLERSPPIIDQSVDGVAERLNNPRWVANASPDELAYERAKLVQKRYEASHAELQPDGAGTKAEHQTFTVRVNPDGTVDRIEDQKNWQQHGPFSASFDVSDAMMRSHGIDPYASYKRKVLDETREQRFEIGKRYRTQQLAHSRQLAQKNLERLVATARDPVALKQGLFELWDDCAETGSDEIVAGGHAAREHVMGYIRSKLPTTSPDTFTPAELARFNKQRKSQATFAPYE